MKNTQSRAIYSPTLLLMMKTQRTLADVAAWIGDFIEEVANVRDEANKRLR